MSEINTQAPKYTKVTSKNGKVYYKKPLDMNRRDKGKYYEANKPLLQKNLTLDRILNNKNVGVATMQKHEIDKVKIVEIFSNKIKENPEDFEKYMEIQNKFLEKVKCNKNHLKNTLQFSNKKYIV